MQYINVYRPYRYKYSIYIIVQVVRHTYNILYYAYMIINAIYSSLLILFETIIIVDSNKPLELKNNGA